jgi:hypothetical protein
MLKEMQMKWEEMEDGERDGRWGGRSKMRRRWKMWREMEMGWEWNMAR